MRQKHSRIIAIVLIVAAIAGGGWWWYRYSHPPLEPIVAKALFHEQNTTYYTATASVDAPFRGEAVTSQVTILHARDTEEIIYPTDRGLGMYSKTRGNTNHTYVPKTDTLLVSRTSPLITPAERARLLFDNYKLRYAGPAQVAGRAVYKVEIISRLGDRPARKLWIDREHHVVLRTLKYSHRGDERGGTQFTHVEYSTTPDPSLVREPEKTAHVIEVCRPSTLAEMKKELGVDVNEPSYVPAGFKLEGRHIYSSPCGRCQRAAQLTYTDGLSVISVFQKASECPKDGKCGTVGNARMDRCTMSCCDVADSGRITHPDKSIVVVADLPAEEIQKIAASIK